MVSQPKNKVKGMAHLVDMGSSLPRDDSSLNHLSTATAADSGAGKKSTTASTAAAGSLLNLSCEQFQKMMNLENGQHAGSPNHRSSPTESKGQMLKKSLANAGNQIKAQTGGEGSKSTDEIEKTNEPIVYLDPKSLVNPSDVETVQIEKYFLQRIQEGHGEFVFELGSGESDDLGLSRQDLEDSIITLNSVCEKIQCSCMQLRRKCSNPTSINNSEKTEISSTDESQHCEPFIDLTEKWVSDFLIRKNIDESDFIEVRVAVVGNVDAGKSTLLGVLTNGVLDDGRGNARQYLFRHKHEMESGRTSSVGNDILGFDQMGNVVNKSDGHGSMDWTVVCKRASKVITFIDLAGHEKYLKTTIFGMTGHMPDFCMLMVGSNAGVVGMTKEHLGLALALNVPVFVVVTKIDMCPENVLKDTLKLLQRILKSQGCRKIPIFIQNTNDVVVTATNFTSERVCPIFQISNVTGENLHLLKMFLNLLSARSLPKADEPAEFQIDDIYSVPGVGTVVAGTMLRGTVNLNDVLLLGPDSLGEFVNVPIKSIQRKRLPVKFVKGGQTASFALKKIKRNQIRKGMVLVSPALKPFACWEFEGEILVLHHPTTISVKYQAMVHCCSVRQTAAIIWMNKEALRTGDKASIRFRFIKHPEYLRVGTRLVFREGRTKAVGSITKVYHPSETPQKPTYRNRYAPKYHNNQTHSGEQGSSSSGTGVHHNQGQQRFGRRRGGTRQRKPPPQMGANFQQTTVTTNETNNNNQQVNVNNVSQGSTTTTTVNTSQVKSPTST
ncbi:GTP-binding protein 1-like isoform X2 [Convolutriloba macropyga]|uniref:GTP-binding protein 1-like isoform X2 n=1 Tax=Convolutriloba macropyga TaxID=536237 RepID=UPI003F51F29A